MKNKKTCAEKEGTEVALKIESFPARKGGLTAPQYAEFELLMRSERVLSFDNKLSATLCPYCTTGSHSAFLTQHVESCVMGFW